MQELFGTKNKLKSIKTHLSPINIVFTFFILLLLPIRYPANSLDSLTTKKRLINTSLITSSAISFAGLHQLWYKDYPSTTFHFFNDLEEWKYMDKTGHICTSYHLNKFTHHLLASNQIEKPLLKSSIYSFAYMLGIEAFDGFSQKWGFSNYDILSNAIGTLLFAVQEKKFKYQFLKIKFSSHQSNITHCRPNLLGKTKLERVFKDYNGQSYWVTLNLNKTFNEKIEILKYIDLAIGYTIDGFIGARNNQIIDCNCIDCNQLNRTSSLLLSLDINLEPLKGKNKLLDVLIKPFSILKFPAPTIIFQQKPIFKTIYF